MTDIKLQDGIGKSPDNCRYADCPFKKTKAEGGIVPPEIGYPYVAETFCPLCGDKIDIFVDQISSVKKE